jgi:hydroxyacylglutathione hydrolase
MEDFVCKRIECGPYAANSYLLYRPSREDALLIDAGDGLPVLTERIAASGKRLTDILLTHGHFDHMLAAKALRDATGARVHIHPLDAPMLSEASLNMADLAPFTQTAFAPFDADRMLSDGPLNLCGLSIQVVHCPGHTPGGVSFHLPEQRALYSGDTLFAVGFGRYDLPGGNPRDLYASIRKLIALPGITLMCPGHGESVPLKKVAEEYKA